MKKALNIILIIVTTILLVSSCSDFPSRFSRLDGDKIRPLAIICDPPEAMPGDTVRVRFIGDFPKGVPDIQWTVALDYKMDAFQNDAFERNIKPIEEMPGYQQDTANKGLVFSFVIPDSVLLQSTGLKETWQFFTTQPFFPLLTGLGMTSLEQTLTLLKTTPTNTATLVMNAIANSIGCRIRLRAHIEEDITLDVTKFITVRYSKRFGYNNTNPERPKNISVIRVYKNNIMDADSITKYKRTFYILTSDTSKKLFPQRKILADTLVDTIHSDTVVIDTGCSYFTQADSTTIPEIIPFMLIDSNNQPFFDTTSEQIEFRWFIQHLDEQSGMVRDSLILFQGNGGRTTSFLPPVDTRLRQFRFHVLAQDDRLTNPFMLDPLSASGLSYLYADGHFYYTDAYIRKHPLH
jgi:hypothetical protein